MREQPSIWQLLGTRPRFRLRNWRYELTMDGQRFHVMIVEHQAPHPDAPVTYRTQISRGPNEPLLLPIQAYATRDDAIAGAHNQIEDYARNARER